MQETGQSGINSHYSGEYAKLYLEKTIYSPYTINKSRILASTASELGVHSVLDFGSNVHGSVNTEGSLRTQMNKKGIDYKGVDLSYNYFNKAFLREQGVSEEIIYPKIKGIVGDLLKSPIKSDSIETIVCCDVLEHVSDRSLALQEIHRMMQSHGVALVVLPSLYKLDMADFGHIEEKRKSSHLEKQTIDEWISLCEKNGLEIDKEKSAPIGVASGLSYLAWMDEKFIPERNDLSGLPTYSPKSILHKNAKNVFSKYDELLDLKINSDKIRQILLEALKEGDIKKVFQILKDLSLTVVSDITEVAILEDFFNEIDLIQYEPERIEIIKKIFINSKFTELLLGNSVLLVLKKKN